MRVGFTLIGGRDWTGGHNYLLNLLRVLREHEECGVEPVLFVGEDASSEIVAEFAPLVKQPPRRASVFDRRLANRRLGVACSLGDVPPATREFRRAGVDVVFEAAQFYGWRFPIPTLAWTPDFQHRHLPHMFSRVEWLRREIGYRAQVACGRTLMLSSEDARADAVRFYPVGVGRTWVVRFAVLREEGLVSGAELLARYDLPPRFFYLPNQFWKHKNHRVVIEAVGRLHREGRPVVVVASGNPGDTRHADYYRCLVSLVSNLGLEREFRMLGMLPYSHVLGLIASCHALVNPSLFEGWSTTVEEAKALGASLLLSDLPVHREQAHAEAAFFDPRSPESVATALHDAWLDDGRAPSEAKRTAARAAGKRRVRDFAEAFSLAASAAVEGFSQKVPRSRRVDKTGSGAMPGRLERQTNVRIVFVEQFYYPDGWGGAQLPRDVTMRLAGSGYTVEVICGSDPYVTVEGDPGPDPAAAGVRVRRVPRLFGGEIHRHKLLRQLWFCAGMVPRLLFGRAADMYVAQTNPPLTVPIVAAAAWLRRRPFILIAMDIYPDVIVAYGALAADSVLNRILESIFRRAYRSAQRVISLGPVMSRRLIDKGVASERIREVSNWATGATGIVRGPHNRLRAEWELGTDFVLLYSGNLGIGHEFETLLQGFAAARRATADMLMVVVGKGSRLEETRQRVQQLGLDSAVRFADLVPAERLPESLGVADLAVATLREGFEGLIVPSKVLGYLARAIPVLYIGPRSDIDHLIERYDCGYALRNGNVAGVAAAILDAHADRERLQARGRAGQAGYESELCRELGLARYEAVIGEAHESVRVEA